MTSANYANEKSFVPFERLYGHDPDFQIYNDLCKDTLQKSNSLCKLERWSLYKNVNILMNVLSTECVMKMRSPIPNYLYHMPILEVFLATALRLKHI